MKFSRVVVCGIASLALAGGLLAAGIAPTNNEVVTAPVYVPDTTHQSDPLPDDIFAWDSTMKETNIAADVVNAYFTFNFTNISPGNVTILNVKPSCGCTTAQLPDLPWTLPSGTNSEISVTVNVEGKSGMLFKSMNVATDKGSKDLVFKINIQPPATPAMSADDRARGVAAAKVDRQAVFKDDCATCHVKPAEGKYGKALYDTACAICHEGEHRATMVPDLHRLKVPANDAFWRTWIAHGKPGSLMPAFSTAEGGPLNDMQIASIAEYLDSEMPTEPPSAN